MDSDLKIIIGMFVVMGLLAVIPSLFFIIGLHIDTGSGSQVGFVSATEKEGIIFKTGRAYIKPTLESTQEDIYCVTNADVLKKLEEASVLKSKVKVNYFSWFASGVVNCQGEDAVIKDFETL